MLIMFNEYRKMDCRVESACNYCIWLSVLIWKPKINRFGHLASIDWTTIPKIFKMLTLFIFNLLLCNNLSFVSSNFFSVVASFIFIVINFTCWLFLLLLLLKEAHDRHQETLVLFFIYFRLLHILWLLLYVFYHLSWFHVSRKHHFFATLSRLSSIVQSFLNLQAR